MESSNKDITNNSSHSTGFSSSSLLSKSSIAEQRIESNSFLKEAINAARRSASPATASSPLSPIATKKSRDGIQFNTLSKCYIDLLRYVGS